MSDITLIIGGARSGKSRLAEKLAALINPKLTDMQRSKIEEVNGPDDAVILTVLEAHQQRFEHAGIRVPRLDDIVAKSQHGQGHGNGNGNGNKP